MWLIRLLSLAVSKERTLWWTDAYLVALVPKKLSPAMIVDVLAFVDERLHG
jgi:hypothetical protein